MDAVGKATYLSVSDFSMTPLGETYASPVTKAVYPIAWRVVVPSLGLDLEVKTPLRSQELASSNNAGLSYWEGAVTLNGTQGSAPASGVGYLEMTGYAQPLTFEAK